MILALGAFGWGLLAVGAVSHLVHFDRLVELLALHRREPRPLALALVGVESGVVALTAAALLFDVAVALIVGALVGAVLGLGFTLWVLRLLLTDSGLPCACSFGSGPTTKWSVIRAASTVLIGLLALSGIGDDGSVALAATALVVGAAAGWAGFLLPDAIAWPEESVRLRAMVKSTGQVN